MASRRLDISSLLCPDQPPSNDNPPPVILAPHLRNPALAPPSSRPPPSPPPSSSSRRSYPDDIHPPYPDPPRTHLPPRSIDNLIHPSSQPPLRQHHQHDSPYPPSQPRPSSSSSLSARSPAGAYPYPLVHSPTLSPLGQMTSLPPHSGYTSPTQQRSSSSPFYQPSQSSPLLHRPTSSHSQLAQSQPRHTVSHRSRSNTTTALPSPNNTNPYPPSSPQVSAHSQNKMAFAGLEALVHAATEERKRLSAGSPPHHGPPIDHHSPVLSSHQRHPPARSPEDAFRTSQSVTSPSLNHQREYPPILPASHASRHRIVQNDEPRPSDDYHTRPSPYPRPQHISRLQYEEEQRQQLRERELQLMEQQRRLEQQNEQQKIMLDQQRQEHKRMLDQQHRERQREEEIRDKQEKQRLLEMQERREELDRQRLIEQQRVEKERLHAQQILVEQQMERQREQQRLQEEQEKRRIEQQQREEQQQRRLQEEHHRLELERRRRQELGRQHREEEMDMRRHEEERRRFEEEHRRLEERRLYEERLAVEERRREESRQIEEARRREERQIEELKRREDEHRMMEEQRRREEEHRIREEQERRMETERLLQARLRAEHESQRQQDARMLIDKSLSVHEDVHRHPLVSPPTHSVTSHSSPTIIELPQPHHPYPHISGPRKSDPIQIKRPANHDSHSLHISTSAPQSSSADDGPPLKRQRYSESPPPSSIDPAYPRVVALPSPISTDYLPHRLGSSAVRRPGSGQGRKQHTGTSDAVEREKEKERERERDRVAADGHRIISPLGRRSPPGSQIGRATAAKKSDEARRADEAAAAAAMADVRKMDETFSQVKRPDDGVRPSMSPIRSEPRRVSQGNALDLPVPKVEESTPRRPADETSRKMSLDVVMNDEADVHVKKESPLAISFDSPSQTKEHSKKEAVPRSSGDDRNKSASSRSSDSNRVVVDGTSLPAKSREAKETKESSSLEPQKADAHEWLLDHYTHSTKLPPEPPRSLSPSISPILSKSQPEKTAGTPSLGVPRPVIALRSVSPDADAALERELAELMAEEDEPVSVHKREPDDMDIDFAVAETLEEDDKSKTAPMDVDGADEVEDELLSLVDDRPPHPPVAAATSGHKVITPTIPAVAFKPPPVKANADETKRPSPTSFVSATSPAATSPIIRPPSIRPESDRGSMPPPSAAPRGKEREEETTKKGDSVSTMSAQAAKKKKDVANKVSTKSKAMNTAMVNAQPAATNKQQKAKATATKKVKAAEATGANTVSASITPVAETKAAARHPKSIATKKSSVNNIAASRSRSASVMPTGSADPETEEKEDDEREDAVDDKLYCVCKTKYDEDRFMIACDRCDEWYHTTCVNMPDLEVELVDQFFCPPCIEQDPHSNLKTTYKQRCLNGLRHPDPDSPKACHKPARGAISKYCSDECGVKYMQSRIDAWAKKGGKKEELWESVKHAEKREGVAVCVDEKIKTELDKKKKKQTKVDRETERLQGLLNQVMKMREEIQNGMEILVWRERLLQLASERAEHTDQCGWDQRLCFGEEEWQDFGAGVLESYDDVKTVKDDNGMQVEDVEEEGEWWCPGQKSCKRHTGWQTLRYKDICKEREKKQELLTKLTTRERQLRKRIEDLADPSGRKVNDSTSSQAPLKSSNTKLSNGHAKSKGSTEALKKGKKRKAPAS